MPTPNLYNQDQLNKILSNATETYLYHQTKVANLENILKERKIYSIGTLWGLSNVYRTSISGNRSSMNARHGFIDYVFTSPGSRFKINRRNMRQSLYGKIEFEIDTNILKVRDSFVYPFNTGMLFKSPQYSGQLKSDPTTLESVLKQSYLSYEILVRRKIPLDYINKIRCIQDTKPQVDQMLQKYGMNWEVEEYPDLSKLENVTIMNESHPDFDIIVNIENNKEIITKDRLFYPTDSKDQIGVLASDNGSECLMEFHIKDDQLYDVFTKTIAIGEIKRPSIVKNGSQAR